MVLSKFTFRLSVTDKYQIFSFNAWLTWSKRPFEPPAGSRVCSRSQFPIPPSRNRRGTGERERKRPRSLAAAFGCGVDSEQGVELASESGDQEIHPGPDVKLVGLASPVPAHRRRGRRHRSHSSGKVRCALCGCALERPPLTSAASVAAFIVFAGPRPTDRYIGLGVCLRCTAEPDLPDRLFRHFRSRSFLSAIAKGSGSPPRVRKGAGRNPEPPVRVGFQRRRRATSL